MASFFIRTEVPEDIPAIHEVNAVALAPLVVHPDFQCRGIGRSLIEVGFEACRYIGYHIVVVVGHPGYYPRYGFSPASGYGIVAPFEVADDVFMVNALVPEALAGVHGRVRYPKAFEMVVGADKTRGESQSPSPRSWPAGERI
jgi:putative acetyltransferase